MGLIALLSCAEPGVPVDAEALLARWSLDARGVRPSLADLEKVRQDPELVEGYLGYYLSDGRFGDRVWTAMAPVWLTRADEADSADQDYGIEDEAAFLAAVGEEPLRVLGHIAENDLPYTTLVTGDWTMADERLAPWYPTDHAGEGWQRVTWTDHRPAAGVLATNGLWWRYPTTTGNANRGRANALTRILLCDDVLERSIELDANVDLTDADAIQDAIHTNPSCVACHVTIDPIGSHLWGFYVEFGTNPADLSHYHPEREHLWETYGGTPPGYYGASGGGLADLGAAIAADPRFPTCAVEQAAEVLLQREMGLGDTDALVAHREAFLEGGLTVRALWRAVMDTEAYRDTTAPKLMSPEQFVTAVADLTGFTFERGGADVYAEDRYGLRSMAGGGRAVFGAAAVAEPTPTMTLVHQRLAEAAAAHVAAADRADPDGARLFEAADFETTAPDPDRLRALTLRVLSRDATEDELAALTTLWGELYASEGDAEAAWAGVVAVLLRHPDFLLY